MKSYFLFLILNFSLFQFYTLKGQTMAYYSDLSETIEGEKHVSIYTFVNTYILKGRLRDMSVYELEEFLDNIGVKSVYSSIKIEDGAMLIGEDKTPSELYPLSVLMNLNDALIIANIEIETQNEVLKLNNKGEVFLNEVYIANITKDFEIVDLEKNVLARIESKDVLSLMEGDAQITLRGRERNTISQFEYNGSFNVEKNSFNWNVVGNLLVNGKRTGVTGVSLPSELYQTASVLYLVFLKKKMINLKRLLDKDVQTKIKEKIYQNYNTKIRSKEWEENQIKEIVYNFDLLFEQVIDNETKNIYTKKRIIKNKIKGSADLYDSIEKIEVSIPGTYKKTLPKFEFKNVELKVFQVKNRNVIIKNGELKSSLGDEAVNNAVVTKIELDGKYNISFNYAFLNGEQIVNTIYYIKTSIVNPKKSISDKAFELDLDSKGNPYKK